MQHKSPSERKLSVALFEDSAQRHADQPAVIGEDFALSFEQLNQRANRLAALLTERGLAKGAPALFCFERGADGLTALLALLKLGVPYVPVGPDFPAERIALVAQDAQVRFALCDAAGARALNGLPLDILAVDALPDLARYPGDNPGVELNGGDICWILYTSGSTGRPKGVMGTHLGMLNRLEWLWRDQPFQADEVAFQNTAFTTVDSFWEILGPLCQGRPLRLLPDEVVKDASLLVPALARHGIRRICLVPSYLSTLLAVFPDLGQQAPATRLWVVSGEPLTVDLCRRFYAAIPDGQLSNQYGLTESCADVSHFDTRKLLPLADHASPEETTRSVPIGRAIDHVRLLVLDDDLNPAPNGVEGELYIGGDSVSAGYLGQEELTRQRYLQLEPDSAPARKLDFSGTLLRTGDRVAWRADGELDYLGRGDDQVKMNGYRVELGEIESVLQRHADVQAAAAALQRHQGGHARLAAFVALKPGSASRERDILAELRQLAISRLPAYMMPGLLSAVSEIPRTASGKVDRKALERLQPAAADLSAGYAAPTGEVESWLAAHWAGLLGIDRIGAETSFFTLGGHSLLATQLLSAIRRRFGTDLSLRRFFQAPTIRALAAQIEASPAAAALPAIAISPAADDGSHPLSFPQQRLLLLSQLNPDSAVYHIPVAFELRGDLDVATLGRAFAATCQRHPMLRARFIPTGDGFEQTLDTAACKLEIHDCGHLAGLADAACQTELDALLSAQATARMDLERKGGLHAALLRIAPQRHCLALTFHHVIADGWSLSLFLRQLGETYDALRRGEEPAAPSSSLRYFDFAAWQPSLLDSEPVSKQLDYWKTQLQGSDALLPLPADLPRPKTSSHRGAICRGRISAASLEAIKALGIQHGASPFMSLLAVFSATLARYSGQQDIIVGTPASNRHYPGAESLFGLFVNTVAIRTDCQDAQTFPAYLEQVRETTLAAFENQDAPFDKVVEVLKQARDLSFNPVFQVMFDYQHRDEVRLELRDVDCLPLLPDPQSARFDLSMTVLEDVDGALLKMEYSTDLFLPATIERFCANFNTLLDAVCRQPGASLGSLPLASDRERLQFREWNETAAGFPLEQTVPQLFARQAALRGDAVAVACNGREMSYSELERLSNQLARSLQDEGVGRDSLVAVLLERSVDMVVALLGVLKAGAAYVPIDPAYPVERSEYMLAQSDAARLITSSALQGRLDWPRAKTLLLDADWPKVAACDTGALPPASGADDLAYVIFTSGSTGAPKGVQVVHRGLSNLLLDMQRRLRATDADTLLSVTTISFDIAGLEFYLPLISGGRLHIADKEQASDGELLAKLIDGSRCTIMQATPVTWRILQASDWTCPPGFKILCGGEALSEELARSLADTGAELWNVYGPTETTIWSTAARLEPGFDKITIGHPLANTTIHILDQRMQPVPVGVIGDLYIGGAGLARGYHQRPDLSAERFIEHPDAGRLYFTGDVARFLADGRIEYLGRSDNQIKLRGFRIELGEIEQCLEQEPSIKQAVVVPVKDDAGNASLVAHVLPRRDAAAQGMDFSLFYFSAGVETSPQQMYKLYLESAKRADALDFKAIWTPERHFHPVGGQFPNPSVLGAAIAVTTHRIQIRAGSVVLPLHSPLRVAEEWAVVDQLSGGRVGLAFASGWNPKDFALMPDNFTERRQLMADGMETVKALWRGDKVAVKDGLGNDGEVQVYPRPRQAELETWVTAAGDPSTFVEAGRTGSHLLTHLLGQSVEGLAEKIALYRQSLREHGHDPAQKTITLMLHAFVWKDEAEAVEISRKPFSDYLRAHISLEKMAKSFGRNEVFETNEEAEAIIELAFERYSRTSSLIGSVESCLDMVRKLKEVGVDEIACLVDFGIESSQVLEGLDYLAQLQNRAKSVHTVDRGQLAQHMRNRLPEYMVPAHIVIGDSLPMTSNGKVDRKQLAADSAKLGLAAQAAGQDIPPQTDTQRSLLPLWSEVLNAPVRSIDASFFALGGHSLLAAQLIAKIRKTLNVNLPLRALFEAPTIEQLASRIDAIGNASAGASDAPQACAPQRAASLSYAQERLWFISRLLPDSPLYNVPIAFVLDGALDKPAFAQAFRELLASHEAFRTRFGQEAGKPVLRIDAAPQDVLRETDGSQYADDHDWRQRLETALQPEACRPFDIENEPLLRASLIEIDSRRHLFFLNVHHLIWDGWSRVVFLRELGRRYSAIAAGQALAIGAPGMPYSEFAAWQRHGLSEQELRRQGEFWREKLAGASDSLSLPTDYPRPAQLQYHGKVLKTRLPATAHAALRKMGEQRGVTLFMTLLAAYQSLLQRLTFQDDIIVGVPIANRHYAGVEDTIGLFVNTVAIRSHCAAEMTFADFLDSVKNTTLDAYDHQDIPFERVVELCQARRELNRHPVFQTMFDMQNENEWQLDLPGVRTEFFEIDSGVARFDLLLAVKEDAQGLELAFEYSTELFREDTIRHFADCYAALLRQAAANPERALGGIPLGDESIALAADAAGATDSVVSVFQRQAASQPAAIALMDGARALSYGELDAASTKLARYLSIQGVAREAPVAVLLKPSAEALVAILAILKAGGLYVPIDSDYPEDRVRFILEDSGARNLITDWDCAAKCQDFAGDTIYLNSIDELPWSDLAEAATLPLAAARDLAYAIYTSGSTGTPKGVCVEHQGIVRLVKDNGFLDILPHDRIALASSLSFDAATFEIWGALLNGAALVILDKATVLDPQRLSTAIRDHGLSVMWLTSSLFNQQVAAMPGMFRPLRALIIGGEALSVSHVRALLDSGQGPAQLLNGYGPTENTTFSTTYDITAHPGAFVRGIPIGKPIARTSACILDRDLHPCPAGVAGELYLGGRGLARGYLNRPELTRERFIEIVGQQGKTIRLYKTGDHARYLDDGNIEYLGRVDDQVKLRGFRIELGEIESALQACPGVRNAVVVVRQDADGDRQLAAYVCPDVEPTSEWLGQLRRILAGRIPEYMIPASFTPLDEIPLNASGKLDRRRLPAISRQAAWRGGYQPPRTQVEQALAAAFQEVLGLEQVGVQDHFFQIGGHSLLALRLAGAIESRLGTPVPVQEIFRRPTPQALAELFASGAHALEDNPLLTIADQGQQAPIFLVHPVFGLAFPYLGLAKRLVGERIFGFNNPAFGREQKRFSSLEEQAASYVAALRKVQPHGPYRLGGWSYGGVVAYEMAQQLQAAGETVETLALIDSYYASGQAWQQPDEGALRGFLAKEGVEADSAFGRGFLIELRHNPALLMRYRPQPYAGRVALLRAAGRQQDNPLVFDSLIGDWESLVRGELSSHALDASHDDLFKDEAIEQTAAALRRIFSRSDAQD